MKLHEGNDGALYGEVRIRVPEGDAEVLTAIASLRGQSVDAAAEGMVRSMIAVEGEDPQVVEMVRGLRRYRRGMTVIDGGAE